MEEGRRGWGWIFGGKVGGYGFGVEVLGISGLWVGLSFARVDVVVGAEDVGVCVV